MYFQFQAIRRRATGRLAAHNKAQHCPQMVGSWGLNWTGLYRLPQLRDPSPSLQPSRKQVDWRLTSLAESDNPVRKNVNKWLELDLTYETSSANPHVVNSIQCKLTCPCRRIATCPCSHSIARWGKIRGRSIFCGYRVISLFANRQVYSK